MKTKELFAGRTKSDIKLILKSAGAALLSFLFGAAQLFGTISPFGTAVVSGLPVQYAVAGSVGAIVGSILFLPSGRTFSVIAAILLILAQKFLLARALKRKLNPGFLCLITFSSNAVVTIAYGFMHPVRLTDLLLLCIEVLLASSFTYFFSLSGDILLRKRKVAPLSYAQNASLCILFISGLCALANFTIWNLNLGVIVSVVAIYIAIYRYGIFGGCFCTVMAAIGLNLSNLNLMNVAGILIAAAFIAGAFSPLRKLGIAASFIGISTFALFLMGAPFSLTYRIIDIFLGTAVFLLLPDRLLRAFGGGEPEVLPNPPATQQNVSARLAFASDTIKDLEQELSTVSDKFREIDYQNIGTIYDAAASRVCRGCSRALGCWETNYHETMNAFNPISDILRISGRIAPSDLPPYFRETCCKPEQLCQEVNRYYGAFIQNQNSKRQTAEARRIVFEQFDSIADMLLEVSEEIGDVTGFDESMTKRVAAAYEKLEKKPEQIICPVDRFGRSRIEVYTSELLRTSPSALCQALSEASGRELELPSISRTQGMTRLSFCERAAYHVDFSYQQSCLGNNTVCGDSCETFSDSQGYVYLLVSDGMGSGKRAAIDSAMTCSILEKLIKAGFGISAAVRLLNSSLLVKSTDESLATIDLAKIDLYTGKAEFYKAGAATTFLWTNNELIRVESQALPVGILEGSGWEHLSFRLSSGDRIVMVSDGAVGAGEGWIAETIRQNAGLSPKELSILLCREAKQRTQDIHPDDITILTASLLRES